MAVEVSFSDDAGWVLDKAIDLSESAGRQLCSENL